MSCLHRRQWGTHALAILAAIANAVPKCFRISFIVRDILMYILQGLLVQCTRADTSHCVAQPIPPTETLMACMQGATDRTGTG